MVQIKAIVEPINDEIQIVLVARRHIDAGDELQLNYNDRKSKMALLKAALSATRALRESVWHRRLMARHRQLSRCRWSLKTASLFLHQSAAAADGASSPWATAARPVETDDRAAGIKTVIEYRIAPRR